MNYENRPFIGDFSAAICLILVLIAGILLGQHTMAAFGSLVSLIGWLWCGEVSKKTARAWVLVGIFICFLTLWHGRTETWAEAFLLFGSSILLYQSLSEEGKAFSREGCLWIAVLLAVMKIGICYLWAAGYGEVGLFPGRFFKHIEEAGLFFAVAVVCDRSPRRRFLYSIALGLISSGSGLLCLGFGLLFKKNWVMEVEGIILGLLWNICPISLWSFLVMFLFLCMPEIVNWSESKFYKIRFISLILGLFNPWTFKALKEFWMSATGYIRNIHILFGNGPGEEMVFGGFLQMGVELGIIIIILFLPCLKQILNHSAGKVWTVNFVIGSCAFLPAPFLLGAGCGMGDDSDDKVNGRRYFMLMTIIGLFICFQYS